MRQRRRTRAGLAKKLNDPSVSRQRKYQLKREALDLCWYCTAEAFRAGVCMKHWWERTLRYHRIIRAVPKRYGNGPRRWGMLGARKALLAWLVGRTIAVQANAAKPCETIVEARALIAEVRHSILWEGTEAQWDKLAQTISRLETGGKKYMGWATRRVKPNIQKARKSKWHGERIRGQRVRASKTSGLYYAANRTTIYKSEFTKLKRERARKKREAASGTTR